MHFGEVSEKIFTLLPKYTQEKKKLQMNYAVFKSRYLFGIISSKLVWNLTSFVQYNFYRKNTLSNDLVGKAVDSQSMGTGFSTTGWLQGNSVFHPSEVDQLSGAIKFLKVFRFQF